jgi:hypothetical protein
MTYRLLSTPGAIALFQSRLDPSHQWPGQISADPAAHQLTSPSIARLLVLSRQKGNRIGLASHQSEYVTHYVTAGLVNPRLGKGNPT